MPISEIAYPLFCAGLAAFLYPSVPLERFDTFSVYIRELIFPELHYFGGKDIPCPEIFSNAF
jgi:hypothetical protein